MFLGISNLVFSQQEKAFEHKVSKGETITQIAKNYNVTVAEIYKVNPGSENGIQENTVLIVPNNKSISYMLKRNNLDVKKYTQHQVTSKETLYSIAKQHNISVEELEKLNTEMLISGLKEGQVLNVAIVNPNQILSTKKVDLLDNQHQVAPQETLFSIARKYNVSVKDLDNLNSEILKEGLKISQIITIPNKKKTINGEARIINKETVFHTVAPKETKYAIAKKYGITIEQLEMQNPEIINGLVEGNKLAINTSGIKAKNENEELMVALAEKQAEIEKSKAKTQKIEDLEDRLTVQKELNKKMVSLNNLNIDLNAIDETKGGSVEKLKLVLEANKKIQDVLLIKLDSLAINMQNDLDDIKNKDIETLEESQKLERESKSKIGETNEIIAQLKQNLAENRKIYTGIMSKVQRITVQQNQEYKKKVRANLSSKEQVSLSEINKLSEVQLGNEKKNENLLNKIDAINIEKNTEVKRKIAKASYYSAEAREFDDKLAIVKLQRYQKNSTVEDTSLASKVPEKETIRIDLKEGVYNQNNPTKIEVIKNLNELKNGFYLVHEVFTDSKKRDEFAIKLTDSGEKQTSFFFNVNNFSYYVYSEIIENLDKAVYVYKEKSKKGGLYSNTFIVQILNE